LLTGASGLWAAVVAFIPITRDGPGFGEEPTGWAVGVERRHRHEDFGALFNGLVP
jgi:hypothetical protein